MDKIIEDEIRNNKENIIKNICDLIKIPSISNENIAEENMPFGRECNNALSYILELGENLGFRTKNIDGYCGYIEFGEGEELVGIVNHLDVVPAEANDWKITKPFEPRIYENKIYGRGAIDDKGPTIAALYAMKIIKDNMKINKRVRMIIGLNEEKSWKCIKHYRLKEEIPSIGFSPDADFPCIYAEKGILTTYIEMSNPENQDIWIEKIDCKNNAINVVPKYCEVILKYNENIKEIMQSISDIIEKDKYDIKYEKIEKDKIKLISTGIASHSAHPELGKNAITQMLLLLSELYDKYSIKNELIEFFKNYLGNDYNGKLLELNVEDESGKLTLNIAKFENENNTLKIGMNLRIPIHTEIEYVKEKIIDKASKYQSIQVNFKGENKHLYIPQTDPLVVTLTKVYNEITKSNAKPIAIGGATYARAFKNFVSFGANMPGEKDMCHQADEYIKIDNLIIATKIYAKAIYEIAK